MFRESLSRTIIKQIGGVLFVKLKRIIVSFVLIYEREDNLPATFGSMGSQLILNVCTVYTLPWYLNMYGPYINNSNDQHARDNEFFSD